MESSETGIVLAGPAQRAADAPCLVCGEVLDGALSLCPRCETPHHLDCWDWNGGCGVFGCAARRPAPPASPEEDDEGLPVPGKLGLPVRRTGSYSGVWYVPMEEAAMAIGLELVATACFWLGAYAPGVWLFGAVALVVAWISMMSTRFYIDLEKQRITRAKAILGIEYWEGHVAALREMECLEIQGVPGSFRPGRPGEAGKDPARRDRYELYRIVARPRPRKGDQGTLAAGQPLELCEPVPYGSPTMREIADLFRRIYGASAFPVRIPRAVRALPPPAEPGLLPGREA